MGEGEKGVPPLVVDCDAALGVTAPAPACPGGLGRAAAEGVAGGYCCGR